MPDDWHRPGVHGRGPAIHVNVARLARGESETAEANRLFSQNFPKFGEVFGWRGGHRKTQRKNATLIVAFG